MISPYLFTVVVSNEKPLGLLRMVMLQRSLIIIPKGFIMDFFLHTVGVSDLPLPVLLTTVRVGKNSP
ncbi:hypothetical protein CW304_11360 [Bacillus sp. UFRGS-B20]|nr:hypothetical protein CW304_11360 [Bacillus sp. UFRGS-B20]